MSSSRSLVYNPLLQPDLKLMLAEGDEVGLQQFCEVLNPIIVAEVLQGLDAADAWRVLSSSSINRQAEIFETIEPEQQIELVAAVDRKHLGDVFHQLRAEIGCRRRVGRLVSEALAAIISQQLLRPAKMRGFRPDSPIAFPLRRAGQQP